MDGIQQSALISNNEDIITSKDDKSFIDPELVLNYTDLARATSKIIEGASFLGGEAATGWDVAKANLELVKSGVIGGSVGIGAGKLTEIKSERLGKKLEKEIEKK